MRKGIKIATLFRKITDTEEVEVLVPIRVLVGKEDETETKFYDIISQRLYDYLDIQVGNGDNYVGYYYPETLEGLKKEFSGMSLYELLNHYLKMRKECVYFYALESGDSSDFCLKSLPTDEFAKKFGLCIDHGYIPSNLKTIDFKRMEIEQENMENGIDLALDDEENKEDFLVKEEWNLPDITQFEQEIKKYVFFQDEQIRKILVAIYRHLYFGDTDLKANIFIYGPTGVGKTEILRQISKRIGLPIVIEDANSYTIAGYRGASCEDALRHLYEVANGDLELAEQGILIFDEIDKKHKRDCDSSGISSDGVLHSLLKIIEGGVFEINLNQAREGTIRFDTSKLIVIVSGAFEDLLKKERKKVSTGFVLAQQDDKIDENVDIVDKLVEYGMAREFMGRFNLLVKLNELSKDDLKKILLESESSVFRTYQKQFEELGIQVTLTDELADRICALAYSRHTGARALNNIVHKIFENILYDFFSKEDCSKQIVLGMEALTENESQKQNILKKTVQ